MKIYLHRGRRYNFWFVSFLFLVAILFASHYSGAQTIQTDQLDYPPGATVYISGEGFQPYELVTLQVTHEGESGDNIDSGAHAPWQVIADADGNFSTQWIIPADEDELGATLLLTASGSLGSSAQWIFTDAIQTDLKDLSPTSGNCGSTITVSAKLVRRADQSPVVGATVVFKFRDQVNSVSYTTGSNGVATGSISVPAGADRLLASFAGSGSGSSALGKSDVYVDFLLTGIPTVTVSNAVVCEGSSATLTATGTPSSGDYSWNTGETVSSISYAPATTTTYSVTYYFSGCSASGSGTITVNPKPTASISLNGNKQEASICAGTSTNLQFAGADGATVYYTVSNANGTITESIVLGQGNTNVSVAPIIETTYQLKSASLDDCEQLLTEKVTIKVIPAPPVPVLNALPVLSGECSVTISEAPSALTCAGVTISGTTIQSLPWTITNQGSTIIVWTFMDAYGNSSTQEQTVIVDDITAPVPDIETLATISEQCSASVSAPTATDNCSGSLAASTTDPTSFNTQGTYTITWIYDDGNGNVTTQKQTVIIDDVTPPVPDTETLATISEQCSASVSAPTSTDNCSGSLTATTTDPTSFNTQGTFIITWIYDDGNGNLTKQQQTVIIHDTTLPVIDNLPANIVAANDAGICGAVVTWPVITVSDNCAAGVVQTSGLLPGATFPLGTTTIIYTATDIGGNVVTGSFDVTVVNADPVLNTITIPVVPIAVNSPVSVSATFTDNNVVSSTVTWDNGLSPTSSGVSIAGTTVTASTTFAASGVYTVTISVTDACGKTASITSSGYIVVYDPSGGFVTGGGWIISPPKSYSADLTLTGRANFGFVSKYLKGASVPSGDTEFQFQIGNLNFKSTSYDWLVVSCTKAQYKGTGKINGQGTYGFLITALDGSPDKFRIKIWDKATAAIVYDNQMGQLEDSNSATDISGGSIVVHDTKCKNAAARTSDTEVVEEVNADETISVSAYPNPVQSSLSLKLVNPKREPVGISILDLSGKSIIMRSYEQPSADDYYVIDSSELPEGLYLLRVRVGNYAENVKLMKE